jgi:threonine dehydrogenase-like Zn-dependent dehydrogenase
VRTLVFVRPGALEWHEAPDPVLSGDREALVRPVAATTCDLDQLVVRGHTPFQGPFSIGHECVAEVVDLGHAAQGLHVGQRFVLEAKMSFTLRRARLCPATSAWV